MSDSDEIPLTPSNIHPFTKGPRALNSASPSPFTKGPRALNSASPSPFTQALQSLEQDLSNTIEALHHLKKKVHEAEHTHQDLYKSTGLRDFVHQSLPVWKEEGRLSSSGFLVCLTEEEKQFLNFTGKDEWISVYKIAEAYISLHCVK